MIHRDLKAGNILLTQDAVVKLGKVSGIREYYCNIGTVLRLFGIFRTPDIILNVVVRGTVVYIEIC